MFSAKLCLILLIVITFIDFHQCARYGGSRRGGGGGSPRQSTRRPYTTPRTYDRPYSSTYRPQSQNPRSSTYRPSTTRRSQYQSGSTPRSSNDVGWNVPPKPGTSYTTGQGPQKIKIVNKYNYHYPGYYSLPVQSSHPGYYYTPSSYHYGTGDTGSTALGFFLGYSLAKMTTPTFSHYSFYDGYRPRYDHYTVHHYYHDKDSVPQNQNIQANAIVGCVGDSVTICPANTTSLCTSNGALMCVVSATSTVPCTNDRKVNCVTSTIPCVNKTASECGNSDSTTVSIPCISTAQVRGEVKYVNNTIVPENGTTSTENPVTTSSNISSTQYLITTTPSNSYTQYPITTTSSTQYPITTTSNSPVRRKREAEQNFCVTIVALPAKKRETEGEMVLKDAANIFEKFVESAWKL